MDKRAERPNQRLRTRKDLLQAATRLLRQGRRPSLEEVAEEALVSRATAYRYFPHVKALLVEASLDVAVPEAGALLEGTDPIDAIARMQRVDTALHEMVLANEPALRTMLVHSLERAESDEATPARQNRRSALIDAALAPSRRQFRRASLDQLRIALAILVGTESMIVCKDVLRIDDADARRAKRWAIRALIEAARRDNGAG
jgi:AcrR family transcriptional regulator